MQCQRHHAPAVGRVRVQLIGLIPNDLHEIRPAQALADKQADVVLSSTEYGTLDIPGTFSRYGWSSLVQSSKYRNLG
jgi:type VI protein secretion system component VasK